MSKGQNAKLKEVVLDRAPTSEEYAEVYDAMSPMGRELFDLVFSEEGKPDTPLTMEEINREIAARRAGAKWLE